MNVLEFEFEKELHSEAVVQVDLSVEANTGMAVVRWLGRLLLLSSSHATHASVDFIATAKRLKRTEKIH